MKLCTICNGIISKGKSSQRYLHCNGCRLSRSKLKKEDGYTNEEAIARLAVKNKVEDKDRYWGNRLNEMQKELKDGNKQ